MKWILDTNVISETRKERPSHEVMDWLATSEEKALFTSVMNIAELVYGASRLENQTKRKRIETWIETSVRPMFASRTLAISETILARWRTVMRQSDVSGMPAPAADLLVAAVALEHHMGVATRDVAPFVACGVPTINPWTGERFNVA